MFHHGKETYDVAAKKAGDWAKAKLQNLISQGQARAEETLRTVDAMVIDDAIVPGQKMKFFSQDGKVLYDHPKLGYQNINQHALNQMVARLDGTKKVSDWSYEPDTAPEFAAILNKKFGKRDKRYLVRSVKDEVRGFMSDRYRRLDNRPMIDALVSTAIKDYGAVPVDAKALDTSFHMKLLLPQLYEPMENEVGCFGLTFRNSDFGAGRLYIKGFFNRLWCTNLAMTEDGISQVHLGRQLCDDIEFSERTYQLDSMTMASAIKDVVGHVFSPANIAMRMLAVQNAAQADEKLDIGQVLKGMAKNNKLQKGEAAQVSEAFNSADVEMLPAGQTRWRLSNAISLVAQGAEADRQLELESLAGEVAGLKRGSVS